MKSCLRSIAIVFACTSPAFAHAMLEHGNPGAGTTLTIPPRMVALDYIENIRAADSRIAVTDSRGQDATAGPPSADGATMQIALRPLGPGRYRVSWQAVSVDGHRTSGHYTFTVAP